MDWEGRARYYVGLIGDAFPVLSEQLAGSTFWREAGDTLVLPVVTPSGERLELTYRDFNKPYGLVLPDTPITQHEINAGKKEVLLKLYGSSNKEIIALHLHRGPHNTLHLQSGNAHASLVYSSEYSTFGGLGSEMFVNAIATSGIIPAMAHVLQGSSYPPKKDSVSGRNAN